MMSWRDKHARQTTRTDHEHLRPQHVQEADPGHFLLVEVGRFSTSVPGQKEKGEVSKTKD